MLIPKKSEEESKPHTRMTRMHAFANLPLSSGALSCVVHACKHEKLSERHFCSAAFALPAVQGTVLAASLLFILLQIPPMSVFGGLSSVQAVSQQPTVTGQLFRVARHADLNRCLPSDTDVASPPSFGLLHGRCAAGNLPPVTAQRYADDSYIYVNYSSPVKANGWFVARDTMRGECTSYSDSELLSKLQGTVEVRGSSDAWQTLPGFPASTQAKCSPSSLISAFVQEQLFEPCHGERAGGNGEDKCPSQAIAVFAASSDDSNCNWMDYLELAIVNMLAVVCACAAAGAAWFQISVRYLLNKASVIAAVSGWILFAGLSDRAETAQGTPSALPPFLSLLLLFPGPLMLDAFALEASFGVTCVWLIAVTTIHPQSDDTSRALGGWHALRIMTTSL